MIRRFGQKQKKRVWWTGLFRIPAAIAAYVVGRWRSRTASQELASEAARLRLTAPAVSELKAGWLKLEALVLPGAGGQSPAAMKAAGGSAAPLPGGKGKPPAKSGAFAKPLQPADAEAALSPGTAPSPAGGGGWPAGAALGGAVPQHPWAAPGIADAPAGAGWGAAELALIERIRGEIVRHNRNNVTRTEAYRELYARRPELHWALLAHMVSRNSGWNMTDLQGEWLPRLLDNGKRKAVFGMLERANALIFQDAYPQLLLYEAGLKAERSLFHLLPAFGVSAFMRPVWEQFARTGDAVPLTVALIVNEQHYIEHRIIGDSYYRKKVLGTLFFGVQALLQLNQVVFPYGKEEDGRTQLAGLVMENFSNLRERIEFGKRLYALLFGVPGVSAGVLRFVRSVRHTGSRADYAPELFEPVRSGLPGKTYSGRIEAGRLKAGAQRLYSPPLESAWPDRPVDPPEPGDWFGTAAEVLPYFRALPLPESFEMTNEYGFALSKIEMAVMAVQQLGAGAGGAPVGAGARPSFD
ncbi:hypothetical protein VN24_20315 [Paenibacillus beijingensis]|uniref:DUF2515 domain-containing protein n=2 Tax=Paenibacillus beijingensis TaxID=1126833 RepID=A0A0D5NS99_9BACL|nr:hypothetical protein VN24_20315 [Paenibacillus beijingensis]